MRTTLAAVAMGGVLLCVHHVLGHGIPIGVDVVDNKLTLADGTVDPDGYAPMVFLNADEDGQLDHTFVPGFGNVALTSLPGFDISGMDPGSGLFLDIIPRPVKDASPLQERLLWHWDTAANKVQVDPNDESLVVASEFGQVNVPQTGMPVPVPLKVANPDPEDLGQHVHFLRYLLGDSPPAAIGAYGFFARLTSPNYVSSDPMLVIFNNGIDDPQQLADAALAINAAAFLPGDYDHDDHVDAADYILWRKTFGSTTDLAADGSGNQLIDDADYGIWRKNFGHSILTNGQLRAAAIPEPASWLLLGCGLLIGAIRWRNRHRAAASAC